jgi:small subunit ribosomal protein S6
MREYELVVVIDPEITEEDVPAAIERLNGAISARGGEVVDSRHWGRRRLAYPIGKHNDGNYIISQVTLDPARVHDLESQFKISEEILRHMFVRKDEK